jgi:hypothetical protein
MGRKAWIAYLPEVRYIYRQEIRSTSGRFRQTQSVFGEIGQACHHARSHGRSEEGLLADARQLTERVRSGRTEILADSQALELQYLLGSQLVRNRDGRAAGYLWQVVRTRPWHWKAWIRLVQSSFISKSKTTSGPAV